MYHSKPRQYNNPMVEEEDDDQYDEYQIDTEDEYNLQNTTDSIDEENRSHPEPQFQVDEEDNEGGDSDCTLDNTDTFSTQEEDLSGVSNPSKNDELKPLVLLPPNRDEGGEPSFDSQEDLPRKKPEPTIAANKSCTTDLPERPELPPLVNNLKRSSEETTEDLQLAVGPSLMNDADSLVIVNDKPAAPPSVFDDKFATCKKTSSKKHLVVVPQKPVTDPRTVQEKHATDKKEIFEESLVVVDDKTNRDQKQSLMESKSVAEDKLAADRGIKPKVHPEDGKNAVSEFKPENDNKHAIDQKESLPNVKPASLPEVADVKLAADTETVKGSVTGRKPVTNLKKSFPNEGSREKA